MDKESFGAFIAEQRKEKNLTQKELADRLLISDKAVSKWERGLSFPDITLLEPLADVLSVSIAELMEGRKISMEENFKVNDVEEAVQKTIELNEQEKKEEKRLRFTERLVAVISFVMLAAIECFVMCIRFDFERISTCLFVPTGLAVTFGVYIWLFMREKLPTYYDENKINQFSDGAFRMNCPGVYFNNSNWKHIVHALRIWSALFSILYPMLIFLEEEFLQLNVFFMLPICLIGIFTVFIPIYVQGKKYQ